MMIVASATDTAYAPTAGGLGPLLARRRRTLRIGGHLVGAVSLDLGILTFFGQRPAKP